MTESTTKPDLTNARRIGGGGTEPDPEDQATERPEPDTTGTGVDLKTSELPDPDN